LKISANLHKKLKESGWLPHLEEYFKSDKWKTLLSNFNSGSKRCPRTEFIFRAFFETPFDDIKVVIVGDEPYNTPGTANGMAFAAAPGRIRPPALSNIIKEAELDMGFFSKPNAGTLLGWANQGVFLLNSVLTSEEGVSGAHRDFGWEDFTDFVINAVAREKAHLPILLWGDTASSKLKRMPTSSRVKHLILEAAHPGPKTAKRGFFGCKHFSKTNKFLKKHNIEGIEWNKIDLDDLSGSIVLPKWTKKDEFYGRNFK